MKKSNPKVILITGGLFLFITLIVLNVMYVAFTKKHLRTGTNILAFQENKALTHVVEKAKRGTIYDRNGEVIAQDIERYHVFLVLDETLRDVRTNAPLFVEDKEKTASKLNEILGIPKEDALAILSRNAKQVEIGQYGKAITKEKKEALENTELPGIRFNQVLERVYPSGKFSSNILGYARFNSEKKRIVGELGIEAYLDNYLTGEDGLKEYKISKTGKFIPGQEQVLKSVKNGNDVYLTLDKNIQSILESLVEDSVDDESWVIISNAKTGEILGAATSTGFDLNQKNIKSYANIIGDSPYEPGSVIKAFTYAAAFDVNALDEKRMVDSNPYHIALDGNGKVVRLETPKGAINTVYNAGRKTYGYVDYREGLARSLNSVTIDLLVNGLNFTRLKEYFNKFKLYDKIEIPGINTVAGTRNFRGPLEIINTAFGQGSSTTALNIVQAFSALLNQGIMTKPYIIESVVNSETNEKIYANQPEKYEILKQTTAEKMIDYLKGPVDEKYGTAHQLKSEDINVIAKTGTAQTVEKGRYSNDVYIHSVMAAAPAEEPEIILYYAIKSKEQFPIKYQKLKSVIKVSLDTIKITTQKPTNNKGFKISTMPNLMNHTKEFVEKKMTPLKVDLQMIGEGDVVISQYPEAKEVITSGRKVFLYTGGIVRMPDMQNWTYKEVAIFSRLSGLGISIKGSGKVIKQNIKPNTVLNKESDIVVELK